MKRYFLDQDDSGHWYVVEEAYRDAWFEWLDLDSDSEDAWVIPHFAKEVGGCQTLVTFVDPEFV